jgi:hypothetical protein
VLLKACISIVVRACIVVVERAATWVVVKLLIIDAMKQLFNGGTWKAARISTHHLSHLRETS